MTFAEVVRDINLYERSKEYYDLVKECAELTVMGTYVDNQRYVSTNKSIVESVTATAGVGYFMESVSDDDIHAIEESFKEKAGKVWTYVKDRALKVWNAFLSFITKLFRLVQSQESQIKAISEKLNKVNDASIIDKAAEVVRGEADKLGIGFDDIVPSDFNTNTSSNDDKVLLTNALATSYLSINGSTSAGCMAPNEIVAVGKPLYSKEISARSLSAAKQVITSSKADSSNGINIEMSKKAIDKAIKDITKIRDNINAENGKFQAGTVNNASADYAKFAQEYQEVSNELCKAISTTITVLNKCTSFRANAIKALNKIADAAASAGKKQQKAEDDGYEDADSYWENAESD